MCVSSGGGAVLNPEASVFHLPPPPPAAATTTTTPTPTTTPVPQPTSHHHTPINGYHTHVYPFMNGDVGQQYCGVCPPTSDTTGATMAVDSPVEGAAPVCPAEGSPVGDPAPVKAALLAPKSPEVMATTATTVAEVEVAAATCTQEEGSAAPCSPLSTPQQNGEVSPESSQPSASPQPSSPLATPPPGSAHGDTLPQDPPAAASAPTPPPEKREEVTEAAVATTTGVAAGKDGESGSTEGAAACGSETQGTQTTPAQTPTPGTPAPPTPPAHTQPQPLTRDQIKQLVAQQVEYFFSRENLSNDPYLISQMDSDQYVPVYILADCSQFKNITKDHSIIVEALKESPFVQLDEENNRVRPNYKRCIVILREIPESTPVDEIETMFKSDECPKLVSCEFVHNSSWYVTFESDEDAQKAYWYLRGVVKTFKDKPILARIKTKPMSRLGCLSVLPSYGNKGGAGGEGKEGCGTPQTPGPAGMTGNPGNPPPTSNYNPPGGRFMYSTPSSVTPSSYSYSYTTPTTPMPAAFFYPNPNMMHWTQPGGFYDINSFLQFNGLSPQAAFKPPTNHNMRYPGSRRNSKHRDGGRYDKGDGRHNSGASQGTGHMPHPGHYQRHHLRPQAPQSPSQASHRVPPHQAPVPSAPAPPVAATPPPPPPPPPPQSAAGPSGGGNSHDSFAHSDFSIASQSSLYTSFSPPMGQPSSLGGEKKEAGTVTSAATTRSNSIPNQASVPPSTTTSTTCNPTTNSNNTTSTTTTAPPTTSTDTHQSPSATPTAPQLLHPPSHAPPPPQPHHRHQYSLVGPPPPPPPHRGGYGDNYHHPHHPHHPHHHMVRDPQQARQVSRGMRRRPRREDEGLGGGTGGPRGGPGQRVPGGNGGPSMPPGADTGKTNGTNHQDATHMPPPPPPPPQFDLESGAFPPLPGSDEQAPVMEEKRPSEPVVSAWGSDTQRFSDVMKGTAKPRPTSQSSVGEKEVTTSDPPTPSDTTPAPTQSAAPTVTSAQPPAPTPSSHSASQAPSSGTTQPTSTGDSTSVSTITTTTTTTTATVTAASVTAATAASVTAATVTASSAAPTSAASSNSSCNTTSRGVELRSAPQRPDRRAGMGGPRERREYHRDYQRDGRNNVGGRGNDHRTQRDNTRSGKENRPLAPRPSREERMDADGWITKGPKETRAQRENREQWERAEARDARYHLVNGDSSPPPSPKPQKKEVKVSSEEACVEESKVTPQQPLNNNDGEHKTSWAKMALASKDEMERLAAELKEKEEQEKIMKQRLSTRPQPKPQEKVIVSRERDGKLMRRDGPPRDNRMVGERGNTSFRPRDSARPKSPK
ncbi:hypothetical protein Pmani_017566 [Petrolisthes manimaculis]|uniref:HTH La-type RNA-binding domain-containing protein n=1 Tax=Petrolisthes manimaculis TaxID=1843537 RepID=A0AAE1PPA7_9EUCA|nr:hypothetical protein Pmani_017566 [Petrolisthes manimaculis]